MRDVGGAADCQAKSCSSRSGGADIAKSDKRTVQASSRKTCSAACAEEASCRMFLCARCRSQVLVCRRRDRGQIYCAGTCAQQARCHQQSEGRRRYHATAHDPAMHADRNRRYRSRQRGVTDHSLPKEHEAGFLPGLGGSAVLRGRPADVHQGMGAVFFAGRRLQHLYAYQSFASFVNRKKTSRTGSQIGSIRPPEYR
jgi:hypothetical protein